MTLERILRSAALLIAVLGFIDPALMRAAQDRPTVVVLQASPSDRDLAVDVVAALEPAVDVARTDVPNASAYVIAGTDLPESWRPPAAARVFSVTPAATRTALKVLRFAAPAEISLDSIAPIEVDVQADGTGEREVTLSLMADGVPQGQSTHRLSGNETRLRVPLTFVPAHTGLVRLRVEAAVLNRAALADRVIDVHARAWQVLAFDGRPSYASTFVRRALESDPRFKVTTRVVTSRASAIQTNVAPLTLTDPAELAVYDLIVVGGTEVLGAPEARALQRYLRDRRGGVIVLPESMQGAMLPQLTGQSSWQEDRRIGPVAISDGWTASEFLWPARWPPLSETLAALTQPPRGSAAPLSAVWQMPVGDGRLAVSSAVDGWRSRASAALGFSAFWRTTAAGLAQATPPIMDVRLPQRLLTAGQWARVSVASFSGGAPVAQVTGGSTESTVRLWPVDASTSGTVREWSGEFRVADLPGRYRLTVTGPGGITGAVEFLVVEPDGVDAPMTPALERDGLAALAAAAHGGRVVPAEELSLLSAEILKGVPSTGRTEAWHPMRSIWWLIPFTLCSAGEWWLRRHRGER